MSLLVSAFHAAIITASSTRKRLGIRKPRETAFTKDELRGWSWKVLALMANLTRTERERVLRHALKVNQVCPAVGRLFHVVRW